MFRCTTDHNYRQLRNCHNTN